MGTGQGDKSNSNSNSNNGGGDDLDFFARERALLGDDAAEFASPSDNVTSAKVEELEEDVIGGNYGGGVTGGEDLTEFESSFPTIDTVRPSFMISFTVYYLTID